MIIELIKKYETLLKYLLIAILSFLIDITIFTIFNSILDIKHKIIIATIIARIISSLFNYYFNRNKVFKSNESKIKTFFEYYGLVIIQMLVSAFLVENLYKVVTINASFIKAPVELFLFICNYLIQKVFIFKKR